MEEEKETPDIRECVSKAAVILVEELKGTNDGALAKAALANALAELAKVIC